MTLSDRDASWQRWFAWYPVLVGDEFASERQDVRVSLDGGRSFDAVPMHRRTKRADKRVWWQWIERRKVEGGFGMPFWIRRLPQ
jgi:hypothetical protein